jgi:bifunctional non-homologous end joining protein LigD
MTGSLPDPDSPDEERLTQVRFTNLSRMMYPEGGVTKKDVIDYYIRIAPRILPFLKDRTLTLHRFPLGVEDKGFYEKDAPEARPDYVGIYTHYSTTADRDVHFVVCNNLDTLLWAANLAALELHISLSTIRSYETPDLLLFDIDPEPPLTFSDVCSVGRIVHDHLTDAGIRPYVKTSGKKGLHIVVPLLPGHQFREVREFCHAMGKKIARESPIVVSEFPRSRDPGTIFIDYLQNAHGKTMASPYSLRSTGNATVSAPLDWNEVWNGVLPEDFNIRTMLKRTNDPWGKMLDDRQKIS